MGSAKKISAGLLAEKRYLLAELGLYRAAILFPVSNGCFGWQGQYSGNADANEAVTGLGYARLLGPGARVGLQFFYAQQNISGYAATSSFSYAIETVFSISDHLQMGLQAAHAFTENPRHDQLLRLPSLYLLGFQFKPSSLVVVHTELVKNEQLPLSVHAAVRYHFTKDMHASIGVHSARSNFYMGGGFLFGTLGLDAVASFHPRLGFTPGILLTYQHP